MTVSHTQTDTTEWSMAGKAFDTRSARLAGSLEGTITVLEIDKKAKVEYPAPAGTSDPEKE